MNPLLWILGAVAVAKVVAPEKLQLEDPTPAELGPDYVSGTEQPTTPGPWYPVTDLTGQQIGWSRYLMQS